MTDYIISATDGGRLNALTAATLARVMNEFVLMYRNHAVREDTIVFPAWKRTMSSKEYDEMSDKFDEIERQMFGKDGFEDAERQMTEIENRLGLGNLAQFTPPPPPKS